MSCPPFQKRGKRGGWWTAADGGRARDEHRLEVAVGKGETDRCSSGEGDEELGGDEVGGGRVCEERKEERH